jgi:DNA-binding beta-propeller fold protein YncE
MMLKNIYKTYKDGITALTITLLLVGVGISISLYQKGFFVKKQEGTYSLKDVAEHDKSDDCWVIIDSKVYNMTEMSKAHPSMFNCGGDSSANYHKNHGPTVRSRSTPFLIGNLDESSVKQLAMRSEESEEKVAKEGDEISPRPEYFVKEGSWDTHDLMMVMERDNHALLVIDGSTHKAVGRINDIGFQPHTQVFSPDGNFTYHISRDGWLTKIDLKTLKEVKHVRVGTVSRGTGLTDDGKYVVIGNYEPQNVVVLDSETLETIKTIDLFDVRDGKTVRSRAGAVIEDGDKVFIALKDLQSVWVLDMSKRGFPIAQYFWGIGKEGDTLHDAYLTPDGKYFVAAVQGSDYAWVLDTDTMKEVARVKTGKTPHTGPGATWGDYTFVPALGEGDITAIDMKTWTDKAHIKTAGPGLFVRSFNADPTYPYVWADAPLASEGSDEIYVIDGATLTLKKTLIPMPGKKAVHPEFTRDGKYVYVGVWGGNKVYVYDSKTFEVVTTIDSVTPTGISNVGLRVEEPGL